MKIISGGQSGVDRAALDVAIAHGIAYAGWCPRGGWAEDFAEPPGLVAKYSRLTETPLLDPAQRTEWNVRDSDVVLMVAADSGVIISKGTLLGCKLAEQYRKPILVINLNDDDAVSRTVLWLSKQFSIFDGRLTLSIGGPRESEAPGIYEQAKVFLTQVIMSCSKNI